MTATLPLPRPEACVTALATPGDRVDSLKVPAMMARFDLKHPDSVRKRTRASWPGPTPRWHAHHTSGGTPGGELLFKPAVVDVIAAGGSYLEQVAACAAHGGCPESTPATTATPVRPAYRSPGRRR